MDFVPIFDRVLVRRKDQKDISDGGIIIPNAAKEKPVEGTVVAVGDVEKVAVGDYVLFSMFAGAEVRNDDAGMYIVMDENSILGIIR